MMKDNNTRIGLIIDKDMRANAFELARNRGLTLSSLIKMLLSDFIRENESELKQQNN